MKFSRRRLLVEQIVVGAVLGCGMKVDAMWHVPHSVMGVKFDFIEGGGLTPSQRVSSFEDRSVSVPCLAFVYIGRM